MNIGQFWKDQIGTSPYRKKHEIDPTVRNLAVGAGITAATTAVGYEIGSHRQAADVVTHTQVPYAETVTTQVGTRHETGGFHNHYDFMKGEFTYGYDPLWSHDEPVYETHETGRTLYRDVTNHTQSFPNTAIQGALVGFGVGLALSVGYAALDSALRSRD